MSFWVYIKNLESVFGGRHLKTYFFIENDNGDPWGFFFFFLRVLAKKKIVNICKFYLLEMV